MLARDHYATLGVVPTAAAEEIEAAYRHLSRRYHPDINPGDLHAAAVFERLEEAYGVLADPERRARYDREGSLVESLRASTPGLSVRVLADAEGGSYGELFRRLRDHRDRSSEPCGEDIHATVKMPLLQAELGRRVSVPLRRNVPCDQCSGRGRIELQHDLTCERCGGDGTETFVKGALSVSCTCSDCKGDGIVTGRACPTCNGEGRVLVDAKTLVRVPPGVIDGQEIRMDGAGHCGPRGGERGDLVAICHVERVAGYERRGPHLHRTLPITVGEAVLGAKIEVASLDGEVAFLRLPPGTHSGSEFRVRSHGLELPDGRRGDMLICVQIHVPALVDEDSKELIRQFAVRTTYDPRH